MGRGCCAGGCLDWVVLHLRFRWLSSTPVVGNSRETTLLHFSCGMVIALQHAEGHLRVPQDSRDVHLLQCTYRLCVIGIKGVVARLTCY